MVITVGPLAHACLPRLPCARRYRDLPLRLLAGLVAAQRLSRERALLAEMDDAALEDVGLTRSDMLAALRKPRWRR